MLQSRRNVIQPQRAGHHFTCENMGELRGQILGEIIQAREH